MNLVSPVAVRGPRKLVLCEIFVDAFSVNMLQVKFFYDVISPYAYIAFKSIIRNSPAWAPKLVVDHQPIFLGGVMKRSENKPPGLNPLKAQYMNKDLHYCSKYYNVKLVLPQNMLQLLFNRSTIDAQRILRILKNNFGAEQCIQAANVFFDHIWQSDGTTEVEANLKKFQQLLLDSGILTSKESAAFLEILHSEQKFQDVKNELVEATNEAVDKYKIFGAPSLVVIEDSKAASVDLYFGADRVQIMAANYGLPFELNSKSSL